MWHPSVYNLLPECVVITSMKRTSQHEESRQSSKPPDLSGHRSPLAAGQLDYAKPESTSVAILLSDIPSL